MGGTNMKFDEATEEFIEKTAQTWIAMGKGYTEFLYVWHRIYNRIKTLWEGK